MNIDQIEMNHRFIVTHGSTFTAPEPSYNFQNLHFDCPSNIKVVMFEQFGKFFQKIDSGYIFNYIINGIDMGHSIDILDNHRINIPIRNTKEYYCKVYTNGMLIPNIAFTFSDPSTQVGIFNYRNDTTGELNRATYNPILERNGTVSWQVQFNPSFIDYNITNAILGSTQMNGKLVFYQNPRTSLEHICKTITSGLGPNEEYTLYIISCRYFESPSMKVIENQYQNSMTKLTKCSYIFKNTNDMVENYYNNVILKSSDIADNKKLMYNSIISTLQNDFSDCIREYIDRNMKIFQDFKSTYDELINVVANYPLDEYLSNMPEQMIFTNEQELHSIISPISQSGYLKYLQDNKMFLIHLQMDIIDTDIDIDTDIVPDTDIDTDITEAEMIGGDKNKYVIDLQSYRDLIDIGVPLSEVLGELERNYM